MTPKLHCQYCSIENCEKTECDRGLIIHRGELKMVDKQEYDKVNNTERKRQYRDYAHCWDE